MKPIPMPFLLATPNFFRFAMVLAVAIAALVFTSSAAAETLCVGEVSETCTHQYPAMTQESLESAFVDAETGTYRGPDTTATAVILLGAGTIQLSNPISLELDRTLLIRGNSGARTTIQVSEANSFDGVALAVEGAMYSYGTIERVDFDVTAPAGRELTALRLTLLDVRSATFRVRARDTGVATGIEASGMTHTTEIDFELDGDLAAGGAARGWVGAADKTWIYKSSFQGDGDPNTIGILSAADDDGVARGYLLKFEDVARPIEVQAGELAVQDSLVNLGSIDGAVAYRLLPDATGYGSLANVSIVGSGNNQRGVRLIPDGGGSGIPGSSVDGSIIDLRGSEALAIECSPAGSALAYLTISYSLFRFDRQQNTCDNYGGMGMIDAVTSPPTYADFAAGDFRPTATSPAIDAGSPSIEKYNYPTLNDLAGGWRFVDSKVPGTSRIDIGAYEYQGIVRPETGRPPDFADVPIFNFRNFTGRLKFSSRRSMKHGFAVRLTKPKAPSARVYASGIGGATIVIYQGKKKLRGSQEISLPQGTSYLVFRGKWNKRILSSGRYTVVITPSEGVPNRISMNVTVPKQKR